MRTAEAFGRLPRISWRGGEECVRKYKHVAVDRRLCPAASSSVFPSGQRTAHTTCVYPSLVDRQQREQTPASLVVQMTNAVPKSVGLHGILSGISG